jgi:hypothetical protein
MLVVVGSAGFPGIHEEPSDSDLAGPCQPSDSSDRAALAKQVEYATAIFRGQLVHVPIIYLYA